MIRKISQILLLVTLSGTTSLWGDVNPSIYRIDARTIYRNDKVIYTIPADQHTFGLWFSTDYLAGPIAMGDDVVFIDSQSNQLLLFRGEKLISQVIMWERDYGMTVSDNQRLNSTYAIIKTRHGLLMYYFDGKARLLSNDFKIKRQLQLDLDPGVDGVPWQRLYDQTYSGTITLKASMREKGDRYIVVDLDSLKTIEVGRSVEMEKDNTIVELLLDGKVSTYRFNGWSIYLNEKRIFTLPLDWANPTTFAGPIVMGKDIVFIECAENRYLRFSGDKLIANNIMWAGIPWWMYPVHGSWNSTYSVIKTKHGVLLYDSVGRARLLTNDFKVKRIRRLDLSGRNDTIPNQRLYDNIYSGKICLYAHKSGYDDYYAIIDLDNLKIVDKGRTVDKEKSSKSSNIQIDGCYPGRKPKEVEEAAAKQTKPTEATKDLNKR